MPVNNNTVTVTAGLVNSAIANPPIGASGVAAQMAYTDGDPAEDAIKLVSHSSYTALHSDLGGMGFVMVTNPSANGNYVTLRAGASQVLGVLYPGLPALVPVASGVVIYAQANGSSDLSVGVTAIKTTANA